MSLIDIAVWALAAAGAILVIVGTSVVLVAIYALISVLWENRDMWERRDCTEADR